jgi:undecaprenyl-diphosphatase
VVHMTYLQAIVIALVQGLTELFPISSLGHSVLVPAWIGGSWQSLVTQSATGNTGGSFYLAFIVALHVGTALALVWYFRADWVRIISGFVRSARRSLRDRSFSVQGTDERLTWMLIFATIPVGLTGLLLEHAFRTLFAKPFAASLLLLINGLILYAGERTRRRTTSSAATSAPTVRASSARTADEVSEARAADARIAQLPYRDAVYIGSLQILALLAGISRAGVTMVGGLWRGLDHEDAARFAFLLATPVILAAGVLKLPSLAGPAGAHIHGQAAVGFVITTVTAYLTVRFLVRYFQRRTLTPFAIYCVVAGIASVIRFA